MLPIKYRLRDKNEISQVYKRGHFYFDANFRIKCLAKRQNNHRFAFVISSKTIKKASGRNFLKRKMRAAIYELIANRSFKANPGNGNDIVIAVIKEPQKHFQYQQIKAELERCLKKLSLL